MLRYFKKVFSVVLAAALLITATAPSGVIAASRPGRPSFKVVKRAKKSVTLKINKTKNATGYQIFIANSKHGKYKQTAASRIGTVKITKLKKDKVYYVKARAFKTVGYHITYGKFSKIVKIDKFGKKPKPEAQEPEVAETPVPEATETPAPGATDEPVPGVTETPAPGATGEPVPGSTVEPGTGITQAPACITNMPVSDTAEKTTAPDVTPYP
ncbi:MAG: hypothetical protein HFH68_14985 [Lachnospiraceae bacterium]|nr:hypothetical protein [Lachnospiraceae bacterium]